MQTKADVFESAEETDSYYLKNSYMINKTLSMYSDCILQANYMNYYWSLDGKLKHDFYQNLIRPYKRKFSYFKGDKYNKLDIVKEHYKVNNTKAKEYLELLTDDDLRDLEKAYYKGGNSK